MVTAGRLRPPPRRARSPVRIRLNTRCKRGTAGITSRVSFCGADSWSPSFRCVKSARKIGQGARRGEKTQSAASPTVCAACRAGGGGGPARGGLAHRTGFVARRNGWRLDSRTFRARGGKAALCAAGCVFRRRTVSIFQTDRRRQPCRVERYAPARVTFAPEGTMPSSSSTGRPAPPGPEPGRTHAPEPPRLNGAGPFPTP